MVEDPKPMDEYLARNPKIKFEKENDNTFVFLGKPGHGSTPEVGINSGIIALGIVGEVYNNPM